MCQIRPARTRRAAPHLRLYRTVTPVLQAECASDLGGSEADDATAWVRVTPAGSVPSHPPCEGTREGFLFLNDPVGAFTLG